MILEITEHCQPLLFCKLIYKDTCIKADLNTTMEKGDLNNHVVFVLGLPLEETRPGIGHKRKQIKHNGIFYLSHPRA